MTKSRAWVGSGAVALAVSCTVLLFAGFLLVRTIGSSAGDFGRLVTTDAQAAEDIRRAFGEWIPDSVSFDKCAFAVLGVTSDTGDFAVFSADRIELIGIAERFAGKSIDEFGTRYTGDSRDVTDAELGFPSDREWAPTRIRNGRFSEVEEWTSDRHGSGRFVAIDYDRDMIFLLKWTK